MNGPWKEEDSAFVDSFFLPGGILDPEDEEDIGILSTLPTGQRVSSNPWGDEKAQATPTSPASYLRAAKQNEIEATYANMLGDQAMEEPEPTVNSPLRSIMRPPPGYDGYVNGFAPYSQFPNSAATPMGQNHSSLLPANHIHQASPVHCNGLSHQHNGFVKNMDLSYSPNGSNMGYQRSQPGATPRLQMSPVDTYLAKGPSSSVPSLAKEVDPKHQNVESTNFHISARPSVQPTNRVLTSAGLKTKETPTSNQVAQNLMESSRNEISPKQKQEESQELDQGRNSITSTAVRNGDSMDVSSDMMPSRDSKDKSSEHPRPQIDSGVLSRNDENSVGECSQPEHIDDVHAPQAFAASSKFLVPEEDDEISNMNCKTESRRNSSASQAAQAIANSSEVSPALRTQNAVSLLQGMLKPFSLLLRLATLLLIDFPRNSANAIVAFFAAVYCWILSSVQKARCDIKSLAEAMANSIRSSVEQSGTVARVGAVLLIRNIALVPPLLRMMSKVSLIQVLEEPSSGFCYLSLYFLPSWCSTLSENFDVPHWSAHFIITVAVYLVSHPVKPGILHRGEFPIADVLEALYRNGNHCDQAFIDKDERRASARKRNQRICSKCLRVLRYCLPIFCLIDGFSYDGATMIGDSGASRLTTAFMMSLVRRNLAFSPIGWVSWAVQVLVATYLDIWFLRDTIVLLLGLSSFRLIRFFDQKRLKKKRKRR